jgi:hypothetical protein
MTKLAAAIRKMGNHDKVESVNFVYLFQRVALCRSRYANARGSPP